MSDWFALKRPLIIGHRGASAAAPENTLAAFALAAEQGADGIEFDVQLSADGWPVVIHDGKVDRTTNGTGAVASLTINQLQALDAGAGQAIPTLDEVFETFGPSLLYNVEIKDWSLRGRGLEAAIADRIEAHNLATRTLVSSFNPLALRRARRYLTRSTPLALIREPGWQQYGYLLAEGEADHPHHSMVDALYISWARRRGYRVNTWTVDDPAEARRLVALGVDGIVTNRPGTIRESLELYFPLKVLT